MRRHVLIGTVIILGACGGRQTSSTGFGYLGGQVANTSTRPRAVCTPHISAAGDTLIVRNVCEVDDELYQAFRRPQQRKTRTRVSSQFPAFPDDGGAQIRAYDLDVDRADIQAHANAAADEVQTTLDTTDPISGTGDSGAAWRYIERLPMGVLLATLDILEERARLGKLMSYLQQQHGEYPPKRLAIAFQIRRIPYSGRGATLSDLLNETAEKLAYLEVGERHNVYRYLMDKQQVPRDVETLLEGFMTFEFADVSWSRPVVEIGIAMGNTAPAPIEPSRWRKTDDEPGELYIGKAAHREIANYYRAVNTPDRTYLNHTPIYVILDELRRMGIGLKGKPLSKAERIRRPDILNLSKMYIYEIKPSGRLAEAERQVAMYVGILGKAGISVSLGPAGAPGTQGHLSAPGGVFLFSSPSPGVIVYDYRKGRLVPVPVPKGSESGSWTWELKPLPKKVRKQLIVVTVAVTMAAIVLAVVTAPFSS